MMYFLLQLSLLLAISRIGLGEIIGQDVCACSPRKYEFRLDFDLFCPPVNITLGDAVSATSCLVSPFGDPVVQDLIPVGIQSIDVLELGQDLRVLVQENIEGSFGDGDTFNYTSIAALPGDILDPANLPRAIQINIVGVNQFDESIINVFIITFTNNCGAYPVLFEGQSAGWTTFTDLSPPRVEVCPFGIGTESPTLTAMPSPTLTATPSPTLTATPSPTRSPLEMTLPPTRMSMSMSMSMDVMMEDLLDLETEFGLVKEQVREDPVPKLQRVKGTKGTKKEPIEKGVKKVTKVAKARKKAKGTKKGTEYDSDKGMDAKKSGKKAGSTSKESESTSGKGGKSSKAEKKGRL